MTALRRVPIATNTRDVLGSARGTKWLLYGRLVVAVIILTYLLLSVGGWGETWAAKTVYGVVTGVLALNAFYLLLFRRLRDAAAFVIVQIGVDILIVAFLVYLTGGVTSQMILLSLLLIMASALILSWKAALAFSAESAILQAVIALIGLAGLSPGRTIGPREAFSGLFVQVFGFFAVAALSGLLARRLVLARLLSNDILEAIGQGLIIAGPDEKVLYANDEARRLLGSEPVLLGMDLAHALPQSVWDAMQVDPVTGGGMVREVEIRTPAGELTPVSISVRPALAENEKSLGTLAVLTDRTLERRVEEAMMQAQRSAAISEMAAAIAHEIRNPLAAMRGSVQEIARRLKALGESAPTDADGLFEIVMSESDRLDAIITDFLAFARMRPIHRTPCDPATVLREAATMLEQALAERDATNVKVSWACNQDLTCRLDSNQFRQVLLNLVMNSIDAVDGRSDPHINLSVAPSAYLDFASATDGPVTKRMNPSLGESMGVVFAVEDNGCGMSEETRRKALSPFYMTRERGTGLGLAVVERIVKAHSGYIRIDSEQDKGTTVSIWVPAEGE